MQDYNVRKKQNILFLTRTLGRAGVAVSLVTVLQSLDFEKYDVTLGVQFPIKELETDIPNDVKVVYYGDMTSKVYKKIFSFNSKLAKKNRNFAEQMLWHMLNKLENVRMIYKICYSFRKKYDTAVAYHQGMASKYVIQLIKAKKKILWYHAAVVEQKWYKKIFSKADKIITDSQNARQVLLDEWGDSFANKIITMHCLIPYEEIINSSLEKVEIMKKDGQKIIMSCGRLNKEKGMDLAVKAAAIIKKERPDLEFLWIVVGEGPEKTKIENDIKKLNVGENFKLLGFRSNPYPYFRICDIYVQPSRLECYGLTMAEALVLKKPVITTETAGGRENVQEGVNGFVVEINENSIAKAILSLIEDENLMRTIKENLSDDDYLRERREKVKFINDVINCNTIG